MKQKMYSLIIVTFFALSVGIILPLPITNASGIEQFNSSNFYGTVRAGNCDPMNPMIGVVGPGTPLDAPVFNSRGCAAVTAPDGHQLTLDEFNAVQGTVKVKCLRKGTLVNVHLSGLIPGGVYTAWVPINFMPPPSSATALGSVVGDATFVNILNVSASGEGEISLIQPAGTGTLVPGPIPGCMLGDPAMRAEVHIVYHIDGNTSGGTPGPPNTWVVQERFFLFLP